MYIWRHGNEAPAFGAPSLTSTPAFLNNGLSRYYPAARIPAWTLLTSRFLLLLTQPRPPLRLVHAAQGARLFQA